MPVRVLAWLIVALGAAPAIAGEAEWPQWRGPNRDGKSSETGLLRQWPQQGPRLLWQAPVGGGYSSVSIAGGVIYTTGDEAATTMMLAFDLDGKLKWKKPVGPAWTGGYPGTRSTPTLSHGKAYLLTGRGLLACLDAATGNKVWEVDVVERLKGKPIADWYGYGESVLVEGRMVICTPGGPDACIAALDKTTGATIWASKGLGDQPGYSSPIAFGKGAARQIATLTHKGLVGVSAANGRFLWRYDRPANSNANITTPIFSGGCIFAATAYGHGGGMARLTSAGGGMAAKEVWDTKEMQPLVGEVVLVNGCLYGGHESGGWNCIEFATGKLAYKNQGGGRGPVTFADGMLYFLDEASGRMMLVPATPKEFKPVSTFNVPKSADSLFWAMPVICGGRLYVRHWTTLYAYDIKADGASR